MKSYISYTRGGSDAMPIDAVQVELVPFRGRINPRVKIEKSRNTLITGWYPARIRLPGVGRLTPKEASKLVLAGIIAIRVAALLDQKSPDKLTKKAIRKCIRETEFELTEPNPFKGR